MSEFDDELRAAFQHAAATDPPVDPRGVADAVRQAASTPPPPPGRGVWRLLGGIGAVGVLVGGAVGLTGAFASDPTPVAVTLARVEASRCPGGTADTSFHRGDGVLAVARSEDSSYLAVRSPRDLNRRVWVARRYVTASGSIDDLPVDGCSADLGQVTVTDGSVVDGNVSTTVPTDTTTTITVVGATTTTAKGTPTTTTKPAATTSTLKGVTPTVPIVSTTAAPTTTAEPGDTTPPAIGAISFGTITEIEGINCGTTPTHQRKATVTTSVTDAVGVTSVVLSWSVAGVPKADENGLTSKAMTKAASTYSLLIGQFNENVGRTSTLQVTVTARDAAGNQSTRSANIALRECFFG